MNYRFKLVEDFFEPFISGLESIGGYRVFSATHWQHLIPAGSLIAVYEFDGPFKWCRVGEKPADKRFTALIF